MSGISIPAEAPLPPLPTARQVSELSATLEAGFKAGEDSARALKRQAIKARLDAMRLAPIPNDPEEALARAREASRLARESQGLAPEPATAQSADEDTQTRALARAVIAKARKGVALGSRADLLMQEMDNSLGPAPAGISLSV